MRTSLPAAALAALLLAAATTPAAAVVGGQAAPAGKFPSVTQVTFGGVSTPQATAGGVFGCTGTLIAPRWVLTAGHCGSVTGGVTPFASPVAWPPQTFSLRIGSLNRNDGERAFVEQIIVSPSYLGLNNAKHDVSLLRLTAPATKTPTPIVATADRAAWEAGDLATVAGWGNTREGGGAPSVLQEADVPITTDAYATKAYGGDFDAPTMVGAGFEKGGVDTCQGDSGGPLFARVDAAGTLRVAGATSFGEGCARAGKPGVYARVGEGPIRAWIASVAPEAVAPAAVPGSRTSR